VTAGKPHCYTTSHLGRPTQPGHPTVGRRNE